MTPGMLLLVLLPGLAWDIYASIRTIGDGSNDSYVLIRLLLSASSLVAAQFGQHG